MPTTLHRSLVPCALAAFALQAAPQSLTPSAGMPCRTLAYEALGRREFDLRWILPTDLPVVKQGGRDPAWDLVSRMTRLATLRSDVPSTAGASRCLGDLALAARRSGGTRAAVDSIVAELRTRDPALFAETMPCLSELLCDERLRSPKWDPDHDRADDGIAFAQPLSFEGRADAPWKSVRGSHLVQQAAVLVHADLEAIKEIENDYAAYKLRPGASYESIYPAKDSYVRGSDARGQGFASLRLHFRCDLPFPFGDYVCDLHILNRVDTSGILVTDIYSTSDDFLWMAGRDVFLPVHGSDGQWVGTLVVRLFGFDLKGVPDGDEDRRSGVRSSLGNLKREAEVAFARYGGPPRTITGKVPEFAVRGGS